MGIYNQTLLDWLRDAYAMEKQAIDLMERQMQRVRNYPEFHQQLALHLDETRGQLRTVEDCLRQLKAEPSTLKELTTRLMGNMQSFVTGIAEDEVMKYAIASQMFEGFEIASYRCNITAADMAGEMEIKRSMQEILEQEVRQQAWLDEHIPQMTRLYLEREAAGSDTARR